MKRKKCSWWHQWPLLPTFCIFNDDASAKKSMVVILLMFFIRPVFGLQKGPLNITAVTGITVELKCKVKLHECGNFNG